MVCINCYSETVTYVSLINYSGYDTIGCYKDKGRRAIKRLEGKDPVLDGSYRNRVNPIAKCAVAAMRRGYVMFAVQNGGQCAASATAFKTFDKYGTSTACGLYGEGGRWANEVYLISSGKLINLYRVCIRSILEYTYQAFHSCLPQ